MIHDGLWCAFEMEHMGEGTQRYADEHEIGRADQDAIAATEPRTRRRRHQARPLRNRDRAGRDPPTQR